MILIPARYSINLWLLGERLIGFQPASIIPRPQKTHLPFTLLKIVLNFICISPVFGSSGLEFGLVFNGHFHCEVPFWHILIAPSSGLPFLWLFHAVCRGISVHPPGSSTQLITWLEDAASSAYLCAFILIPVVGTSRSVLVIIRKSINPGFHATPVRLPLNISCGFRYSV